MLVCILRHLDGTSRHAYISYDVEDYLVRSLRSKMSQYFGADAFESGYIEIMHYDSGDKYFVRTKEELKNLEGVFTG